jgi:hypothetical protein
METMQKEPILMPSLQIQLNGRMQMVMATVTTQQGDLQMHLLKIQRNGLMKTAMDSGTIRVEQTPIRTCLISTTTGTTIRLTRCPNWRAPVT